MGTFIVSCVDRYESPEGYPCIQAIGGLCSETGRRWRMTAEELIRTGATRQIYGRYVRDPEQYTLYTQLEKEALSNLQEKNINQAGTGWVRPHL